MTPQSIRDAVLELYDRLGRDGSRAPDGLPVPTGAELALRLGFPPEAIAELPREIAEAFLGAADLAGQVTGPDGDWVLDLGCGAGAESMLLARRGFRVAALDGSGALLGRLASARSGSSTGFPHPVRAYLPHLPLRAGVASWALLNGVANLVPEREALLRAVRRVLRPGGTLLVADLVCLDRLPQELLAMPEAWAWCLAGASEPGDWHRALAAAGFAEVEIALLEEIPPVARARIRATAAAEDTPGSTR